MAASGQTSSSKKGRSVPVAVSVNSHRAPTALPPLTIEQLPPTEPAHQQPTPKQRPAVKQGLGQPVHLWPEARRRRLMWWLVIGGTTVVIIGWVAVLRWEMAGGKPQNLFADAWKIIRSFNLGSPSTTSASEQEIRSLDSQVFPQFQQ